MYMNHDDLICASGYARGADIEKWLISHQVEYWTGKNGTLFTTIEAVNKALLSKTEVDIEFK